MISVFAKRRDACGDKRGKNTAKKNETKTQWRGRRDGTCICIFFLPDCKRPRSSHVMSPRSLPLAVDLARNLDFKVLLGGTNYSYSGAVDSPPPPPPPPSPPLYVFLNKNSGRNRFQRISGLSVNRLVRGYDPPARRARKLWYHKK